MKKILVILLIFISTFVSSLAFAKIDKTTIKINSSLFSNGKTAGLSYNQLTKINKAIVKYKNPKRLRKGDIFKVYFDKNKLKAIKYFSRKSFQIFDFKGSFYKKDGKLSYSMFLSSPLKYKRISSGFTYRRYHPILKTYLPHRAIDYAANKNTKVRATANGVIVSKGFKGALGNRVEIKHSYGYSTVYAHLAKFARGIYKGSKVKKGQVIGFVGSTGRSTGNHLHYELKRGKKYFNPLRHKPKLIYRLKGKELQQFRQQLKQYK